MMISVIVPVYNSENTLCRCVQSVLEQTYTDIELILINDGSSDSSLQICEEFCRIDERVKLISKTNGGVSSARNEGIKEARGELITFVDSDDYLDLDYLHSFLSRGNKWDFFIQGYKAISRLRESKKSIQGQTNTLGDLIVTTESLNVLNSPWAKLFRREIIKKNCLFFDSRLSYGEDHIFVLKYLLHVNTFCSFPVCGYNYIDDQEGSLTHKMVSASSYSLYLICVSEVYCCLKAKYYEDAAALSIAYNRRTYFNLINYVAMCNRCPNAFSELSTVKRMIPHIVSPDSEGLSLIERLIIALIRTLPSRLLIRIVGYSM